MREFLSCNGSYNYVSYVDTGSLDSVPKDYTEYVGNSEKSCGVFSAKGLLSDDEKRELREMLRNTQSCIWDCVISFREEFGDEYFRDYEQAYNFLKKELPKFFTRAGLDKDNIVWYSGLHENTENKHIHISFFEKEPQFMKNNKTLSYLKCTPKVRHLRRCISYRGFRLVGLSGQIVSTQFAQISLNNHIK